MRDVYAGPYHLRRQYRNSCRAQTSAQSRQALCAAQYAVLKAELTALIDPALDSLRFYQLGNNYKSKVEHIGVHPPFEQAGLLLF